MSSVLRALESFVGNESAWREWTALLIRPDLPLVAALRHATRTKDGETVGRLASLLADARVSDRLFNAFAIHGELRGCQIDVARLHSLMQAAVAAAQLAIQMRDVGTHGPAESVWDSTSLQPGNFRAEQSDILDLALAHLKEARYGPAVLMRWVSDYLGVESEAVDHVPLACVIDGCRGTLACLTFNSWRASPEVAPAVVPDLEAALTPMHDDLLTALAAVAPTPLTRSISWRITTPPTLRASNLSGGSLQGAAAVALHLINGGERFHRGVLILAECQEGRLRPVGYEHLKLLAAIESYDRGRASGVASEEQSAVQKVIISEDSTCDMAPAAARGMPWKKVATVHEAANVVADAVRMAEERVYQIARATRTIKAVSAPPEHRYVVETAGGDVIFGPESRTDFISELTFKDTNRLRDPYKLHYRAQSIASRVEADCHPAEDNLYFDDPTYANYEQDKRVYEFRFIPSPGASYSLTAHVFDGFGTGSRNMHCHFAPNSVFDLLIFELDLRAYELPASQFSLRHDMDSAPRLSIWRGVDPQLTNVGDDDSNKTPALKPAPKRGQNVCDRYCAMAKTAPAIMPVQASQGLWRWEIQRVRFGAVLWVAWEKTVSVRC